MLRQRQLPRSNTRGNDNRRTNHSLLMLCVVGLSLLAWANLATAADQAGQGRASEVKPVEKSPSADQATSKPTASQPSKEPANQAMDRAYDDFLAKKGQAAAGEIREAAAALRSKAGSASEKTRQVVDDAAQALDRLADDVEKGSIHSPEKLRATFAQANRALARVYSEAANRSWEHQQNERAGQYLKDASDQIDAAARWAGQKVQEGSQEVIRSGRELGDQLMRGTGEAVKDAASGLHDFGQYIENLGKDSEHHEKPSPQPENKTPKP